MSSIALAKALGALAVAGLTGMGGYNYATNGCFLKMGCGLKGESSAAVLPVAASATDACPLGCSMHTAPAALACCSDEEAAVAQTADAKGGSCCSSAPDTGAVTTLVAAPASAQPACCEGGAGACCEAGGGACCESGEGCCASEG